MRAQSQLARPVRSFSHAEKLLLVIFLLTLPLVNPWIRGDGVGYYAYLHALLVRGDLDFGPEWMQGNPSFRMNRVGPDGRLKADQFTRTGRVDNHFSVGPAMLWAPAIVPVHITVLALDRLGARIPADGYSEPYRVAAALGTACYGFLGLWLSLKLAQRYFEAPWPLLGTLGVWFGTSLPVYMYFNPFWSHALSVFVVAFFLWYWLKTREGRTVGQWALLGLLGGLMVDVYYLNAVLLLLPIGECILLGLRANGGKFGRLLLGGVVPVCAGIAALLPTFITRAIIYGSPLDPGYSERWFWGAPALWKVLFSADHGLFVWTPVVALGVAGLFLFLREDGTVARYLLAVFLVFYYVVASYQDWDGISSYGSRFFVSLTPVFILGLTALLHALERVWRSRRAAVLASGCALALLVAWNLAFIFQWGTHLVPARGPISWPVMARNQVVTVPRKFLGTARSYFLERSGMMGQIEQEDIRSLRGQER